MDLRAALESCYDPEYNEEEYSISLYRGEARLATIGIYGNEVDRAKEGELSKAAIDELLSEAEEEVFSSRYLWDGERAISLL